MEMFQKICLKHSLCESIDECMQLITELYQLSDETLVACVNCAIKTLCKQCDSERWTFKHQPTPTTICTVLTGKLPYCSRLICRLWGIDEINTEKIVKREHDIPDVWKVLLDKFQTDIDDKMVFEVLMAYFRDKSYNFQEEIIERVLNTDKHRTDEEVCELLMACDNLWSARPLLKKYPNIPTRDVLRVCNHLLTNGDRSLIVYSLLDTYAGNNEVCKTMVEEISLESSSFDISKRKEKVTQVVEKYIQLQ